MDAALGVDHLGLGVGVELVPLPKQTPWLAEAPVDDGRPLRDNGFDGVRISLVGLSAIAEENGAHLHDMRGINKAGLQAHLNGKIEQESMIDARGLDDDPELARAALDSQTANVCKRLEDRGRAVRNIPLGRRARTGQARTDEVESGAAHVTGHVHHLSCVDRKCSNLHRGLLVIAGRA
jgi:hypothetical protein